MNLLSFALPDAIAPFPLVFLPASSFLALDLIATEESCFLVQFEGEVQETNEERGRRMSLSSNASSFPAPDDGDGSGLVNPTVPSTTTIVVTQSSSTGHSMQDSKSTLQEEGEEEEFLLLDDRNELVDVPQLEELFAKDDAFEEETVHQSTKTDARENALHVRLHLLRRDASTPNIKNLRATIYDSDGERVGLMRGSLITRRFSPDPDKQNELILSVCEEMWFSNPANDEGTKLPRVLFIQKLVVDEERYSPELIVETIRESMRAMASRFDYAVVDCAQLAGTGSNDMKEKLLRTAQAWTTWQRAGFRGVHNTGEVDIDDDDSQQLLRTTSSLLTAMSSSFQRQRPSLRPVQPFTPLTSQLQQIEHRQGADSRAECVRSLYGIVGIAQNPHFLSQSRFVMDEWGYVGRVVDDTARNRSRDAAIGGATSASSSYLHKSDPVNPNKKTTTTTVFWGNHWDMEAFQTEDLRQSRTRAVIPCSLLGMAGSRKRGKALDVYLNAHNVKTWRKGNGW